MRFLLIDRAPVRRDLQLPSDVITRTGNRVRLRRHTSSGHKAPVRLQGSPRYFRTRLSPSLRVTPTASRLQQRQRVLAGYAQAVAQSATVTLPFRWM